MTRRFFKTRPTRILAIASVVVMLIAAAVLWSRFDRVTAIREMQLRSTTVEMRWHGPPSSSEPTSALLPVYQLFLTNPTAADMEGLAKFPELRVLCLAESVHYAGSPRGTLNNESLRVLRSLPNLREIWFETVDGIDDEGLANLSYCKQLKKLGMTFVSGVTGSFIESLRGRVHLTELELGDCSEFEDSNLKSLAGQPDLEIVVLTYCWLDGTGFEVFQDLKKLKRVEIDLPDESFRKYFLHVPDVSFCERKQSSSLSN